MEKTVEMKARDLYRMDKVIRMVNDEDNGLFESWITECVPDGASLDELKELVTDLPEFYQECCEFFAVAISGLICNGEWTQSGFTAELFNPEAVREERKTLEIPSVCPSCLNSDDMRNRTNG